jgi:Leucine-rich repeat (LRR) protein
MYKSNDQTVLCESGELKDAKRDTAALCDQEINVTILFPNSDTPALTVTGKDTIRDIKQSITFTYGISIGNIQLFHTDTDIDVDIDPLTNDMLVSSLNNKPLKLALILTTDRDVVLEILRLNPQIVNDLNWSDQPELLSDWEGIEVDPVNINSITAIDFPECDLSHLPESLNNLTNLKFLSLSDNQLTELPDLSNLTSLEVLTVSGNQLTRLPDLSNLTSLTSLELNYNQLCKLPDLSNLTNLRVLFISNNQLSKLPDLYNLSSLKELSVPHNQLTKLPKLSNLTSLTFLDVSNNNLCKLPDLSALRALVIVDIINNKFTKIPDLSYLPHLKYKYA